MIGTTELTKRTLQGLREDSSLKKQPNWKELLRNLGEPKMHKIIEQFLWTIKQGLINNEDIVIKKHFSFKRPKPPTSGNCDKHKLAMTNHKKASCCDKKQGIKAYSKCKSFGNLRREIQKCGNCKVVKQKSVKSIKLPPKVKFTISEEFRQSLNIGTKGKK